MTATTAWPCSAARESLAQLLTRLEEAITKALDEDIYTDEINARP